MKLIKDNGEETFFNEERFKNSLMKSGASAEQVNEVLKEISAKLYSGMKTKELYQMAHKELQNYSSSFAARYSLKKALMELGPAGYFFEKWLAKFLGHLGYRTMHSKYIEGHAVTHEADVIAERDGQLFWIECKFRNSGETKLSVTTPMYVLSRIRDISNKKYRFWGEEMEFTKGILVTNSYFTQDSVAFAEYYGLDLLSWDYPVGNSLKNIVDLRGLYPITCLTTLSNEQKAMLLAKDVILVKELESRLAEFRLPSAVAEEIKGLLKDCVVD